jgi:hypothetical protein
VPFGLAVLEPEVQGGVQCRLIRLLVTRRACTQGLHELPERYTHRTKELVPMIEHRRGRHNCLDVAVAQSENFESPCGGYEGLVEGQLAALLECFFDSSRQTFDAFADARQRTLSAILRLY